MNTLFARTLLWFIATVMITFVAVTIAAIIDYDPEEQRRPLGGGAMLLQFSEAQFAYEAGGPVALQHTLERFRRVTGSQAILTDAYGRDLSNGQDRSDLLPAVGRRMHQAAVIRGRPVVGRRSLDGRYLFFVLLPRGAWFRWFLQPEVHLTMLVVLTLLSYAFARHLTNPVRRLQQAVECFGRGEFHTRVRSTRRDEIGQLARTFDQMADRIESMRASERRLLQDISHELRSPLARMTVALELARSDAEPSKQHDRLQKDVERLNTLIAELLQVTRVESDESKLRREDLALNGLVDDIVTDVRLEANARGSRIEWTSGTELQMKADAELLRRAIENVIRNAVRHTPPGTEVDVKLERDGDRARVIVRDYGHGVPEAELGRIFDPFYRVATDRNRASGGTGLGLAIAKRAIELHKGEIRAKNANPGLEVQMEIPV